jgi:hypothetical protein
VRLLLADSVESELGFFCLVPFRHFERVSSSARDLKKYKGSYLLTLAITDINQTRLGGYI